MSVGIEEFFPWVMPLTPGATDLLVMQAIRSAADVFCARSDLIQRAMTADVTAYTEDYIISAPVEQQLARILSVSWNGAVLGPVTPDIVDSGFPLRGASIGGVSPTYGAPRSYFQKTPIDAGFSLYPIPDTAVPLALTVKASFTPINAATTLDDELFNDWAEDLALGAVSILMAMPGQRFSSPASAYYAKAFDVSIKHAKRQKSSGRMTSRLRVIPIRFA